MSWIGFWRPAFGWPDIKSVLSGAAVSVVCSSSCWSSIVVIAQCMTPAHCIYYSWRRCGVFSLKESFILIDESPLFVVAGRWFRSGIRTTGPSDNFQDYGSSNNHAHTGMVLFIYLSLAVHHLSESPISINYAFTYTCSFCDPQVLLPPWSMFNRHPVKWLPSVDTKAKPEW